MRSVSHPSGGKAQEDKAEGRLLAQRNAGGRYIQFPGDSEVVGGIFWMVELWKPSISPHTEDSDLCEWYTRRPEWV